MRDLLDKKLIIFTGKGGVGKSTLCASFAMFAASHGKKVCMVEIAYNEILTKIFNHAPVGHNETEIYPGIYSININKDESLREFVLVSVKLESVYNNVFKNKLFDALFNAMPGLSEMLLLGRIGWMLTKRGPDHQNFDMVIMDAPSTGQGTSLLSTPSSVVEAVGSGPINKHAADINNMLKDKSHTAINLVTLPEDMPVNEAIEMKEQIFDNLGMPQGHLIINKVFDNPFTHNDDMIVKENVRTRMNHYQQLVPILDAMEWRKNSAAIHKFYVEKLRQNINSKFISIPHIFDYDFGIKQIEEIAGILNK